METGNEIRGAVKNIRYYTGKLQELTKLQLEKDFETGKLLGINIGAEGVRFESIGALDSAARKISIYCDNIEANLKSAESQDEKLKLPEETEAEEPETKKNSGGI